MKSSFLLPERRYTLIKNPFRAAKPASSPESPPTHQRRRSFSRPKPPQNPLRSPKGIGIVSVVFAVLVLFVFREIQHTRELYQMSRMVTAAEKERRLWQEKWRLAEGRNAGLIATIHSQPQLDQEAQVLPASYTIRARRH